MHEDIYPTANALSLNGPKANISTDQGILHLNETETGFQVEVDGQPPLIVTRHQAHGFYKLLGVVLRQEPQFVKAPKHQALVDAEADAERLRIEDARKKALEEHPVIADAPPAP